MYHGSRRAVRRPWRDLRVARRAACRISPRSSARPPGSWLGDRPVHGPLRAEVMAVPPRVLRTIDAGATVSVPARLAEVEADGAGDRAGEVAPGSRESLRGGGPVSFGLLVLLDVWVAETAGEDAGGPPAWLTCVSWPRLHGLAGPPLSGRAARLCLAVLPGPAHFLRGCYGPGCGWRCSRR